MYIMCSAKYNCIWVGSCKGKNYFITETVAKVSKRFGSHLFLLKSPLFYEAISLSCCENGVKNFGVDHATL